MLRTGKKDLFCHWNAEFQA